MTPNIFIFVPGLILTLASFVAAATLASYVGFLADSAVQSICRD